MMFGFLDLEFSGLNPTKHEIIEIACVVTDTGFSQKDIFSTAIYYPELTFDDEAYSMHSKNGLLADIGEAAQFDQVYEDFEKFLSKYPDLILAGNSIGIDRKWLEIKMPKTLKHLNHRVVDLSSVKIIFDCAVGIKNFPTVSSQHRAVEDVRHSIALAKNMTGMIGTMVAAKSM